MINIFNRTRVILHVIWTFQYIYIIFNAATVFLPLYSRDVISVSRVKASANVIYGN